MKRKRKFDLKGSITFIQEAVEPRHKNAKTLAACWNKVLKHTRVHIRRGYVVSAAIRCDEDYKRMLEFGKRVNEQRWQMREAEIAASRAMYLNFERRVEYACHNIIKNPIEGEITKQAFEERNLSVFRVKNEDHSVTWHLKQGDAIIKLNYDGETLDDFKRWLHDVHGEIITERGIEKEPDEQKEQQEQVDAPDNTNPPKSISLCITKSK